MIESTKGRSWDSGKQRKHLPGLGKMTQTFQRLIGERPISKQKCLCCRDRRAVPDSNFDSLHSLQANRTALAKFNLSSSHKHLGSLVLWGTELSFWWNGEVEQCKPIEHQQKATQVYHDRIIQFARALNLSLANMFLEIAGWQRRCMRQQVVVQLEAKPAIEAGVELLVLDDGWFGKRDDASS